MAKLKLFKSVIGFHDAYVAAPSRKAALTAWGASTDLFSAGLAEQVDADICEDAFERPGEIVTRKRGSASEWTQRAKPKPKKPSRADLARTRIEQRLARLEERRMESLATLDREAESLRKRRAELESKFNREREKIEAGRDERD